MRRCGLLGLSLGLQALLLFVQGLGALSRCSSERLALVLRALGFSHCASLLRLRFALEAAALGLLSLRAAWRWWSICGLLLAEEGFVEEEGGLHLQLAVHVDQREAQRGGGRKWTGWRTWDWAWRGVTAEFDRPRSKDEGSVQ